MRIEQLFIAIVVFGIIIVTGFLVFEEQIVEYNLTADNSKLSGLRDQMNLNKVGDSTSGTQDKVTGKLDNDASTTEDAMFKGGFSSIKDVTTGASLAGNITTSVMKESGIFPAYLGNAINLILRILAVAFLIYMVLRFKPQ